MENFNYLRNHIVLIGFSKTARIVLDQLLDIPVDQKKFSDILVVDDEKELQLEGVKFCKADYNDDDVLHHLGLEHSFCVVIFSDLKDQNFQVADLRSVSTVFAIESIEQNIHTITEVQLQDNAGLILSRIQGDEVIIKELIDAKVIMTSVVNNHISNYIYDILGNNANFLLSKTISQLGFKQNISVRELKVKAIEEDITVIGYGDGKQKANIILSNDDRIEPNELVYYYKNN